MEGSLVQLRKRSGGPNNLTGTVERMLEENLVFPFEQPWEQSVKLDSGIKDYVESMVPLVDAECLSGGCASDVKQPHLDQRKQGV